MPITLTKHIRVLRGGSQAHLMQANDGNVYVVKFQGNPQGTSVLANEMLAAKLAGWLGLPVPATEVVELLPELSEGLYFETLNGRQPILPGLHLGSRLVISSLEGRSYDFLPHSFQHLIRNPEELIGIQLFDLWTCNRDTRQAVYWKRSRDKRYTVTFIDNGHCFGGPEWNFSPLMFPSETLTEPSATEAWLRWTDRIATFPTSRFESIEAELIPPEWRCGAKQFSVLFEELRIRQAIIAAEMRRKVRAFDVLENTCKRKKLLHPMHTVNQTCPPASHFHFLSEANQLGEFYFHFCVGWLSHTVVATQILSSGISSFMLDRQTFGLGKTVNLDG